MDLSTTPLAPTCRAVALLIDGENVAATLAPAVISAARRMGPLAVARVFGDARTLAGWHEVAGLRIVHAHSGKNVTDMMLTIDALDLSHSGAVDGFALATNDRDFTPLAQALRSRGFPVLGLVGPLAPAMLRDSCSLTMTVQAALPAPPAPALAAAAPSPLVQAARRALATGPQHPKTFANAMHSSGHPKPQGYATWRKWLKQTFPTLVISGDGDDTRLHLPK